MLKLNHRLKARLLKGDWSEVQAILLLFLTSRLALTCLGLIARSLLPAQMGKQHTWSDQPWVDLWGVWDSFWYVDIAAHGYSTLTPLGNQQTNFAFFPLYPTLMHLLGQLLGGNYFLAGILISNLCLLVAAVLLYRIIRHEFREAIAQSTIQYLFLFPTAFIFSGVFTESLYLCLTLLCFYLAQKRLWWQAGIAGACLALTRSLGVLILLPLLYEYLRSQQFHLRQVRWEILWLAVIPLALVGFALYNQVLTGDWLYFLKAQAGWKRSLGNPLINLLRGFSQGDSPKGIRQLLEASFALAALAGLGIYWRKINPAYLMFGLYSIVIPLMTGIGSMPRFVLPIFPLYLALALRSRDRPWEQGLTLFLGLLQGCLMVFWSRGFNLVV